MAQYPPIEKNHPQLKTPGLDPALSSKWLSELFVLHSGTEAHGPVVSTASPHGFRFSFAPGVGRVRKPSDWPPVPAAAHRVSS